MGRLKFVKTSEVRAMEGVKWVVDGIYPEGATVLIYGLEGSHKSFLSLESVFCITTGTPFFGHDVKQVKATYIAAEGGPPLSQRLRAWEKARGQIVDDAWLDWFMEESIMLDDVEDIQSIIPELKATGSKVFIFDTLRTSSSGDEISPQVMQAITRSMRIIARECEATVMVVHHSPKGNPQAYSGSGALGSNITTSINIIYDEESGNTYMACKKQKDAEKFPTMTFKHRKVGDSLVMELHKIDRKQEQASALDENAQYILDAFEDSMLRKDLRERVVDTDKKMTRRTFDRWIKDLKDRQFIAESDGVVQKL